MCCQPELSSFQILFLCLTGKCRGFSGFFFFFFLLSSPENTNFTGRGNRKIHGIRSSFDPRVSVRARVCGPGWPVRSQMHRGLRCCGCQCAVNTRVVRDESGRGGQRQCPLLPVPSDHFFIYLDGFSSVSTARLLCKHLICIRGKLLDIQNVHFLHVCCQFGRLRSWCYSVPPPGTSMSPHQVTPTLC